MGIGSPYRGSGYRNRKLLARDCLSIFSFPYVFEFVRLSGRNSQVSLAPTKAIIKDCKERIAVAPKGLNTTLALRFAPPLPLWRR
jgi:hypothetical protein